MKILVNKSRTSNHHRSRIGYLKALQSQLASKKPKKLLFFLIILLIFLPGAIFLSRHPQKTSAAWFDQSFRYRKGINIQNNGSNQASYQIQYILDTSTLVSSGKLQSNCNDLRFTDINGNLLDYYLEVGCNTSKTVIWIKTQTIPAGSSIIYLYYGNPSASSLSKYSSQPQAINLGNGNDGSITVSTSKNINVDNMISGRSCSDGGDAVNYSVTTDIPAGATQVTLSTTPSAGCLAVGDEILIINQLGTSSDYSDVGKYETARITSLAASPTIAINHGLSNSYSGTTQKITVQRIPNYTTVTVNSGQTLSGSTWNGTKGGIIFFRADSSVTVTGNIDSTGQGYSGGIGGNGGGYYIGQEGAGATNGQGPSGVSGSITGGGGAGVTTVGQSCNGNSNSGAGGGGGGGITLSGSNGTAATCGSLGVGGTNNIIYSSQRIVLGIGGGGGGGNTGFASMGGVGGSGGGGGGAIVISTSSISIGGSVVNNGQSGGAPGTRGSTDDCYGGGGGGGGGGTINIYSSTTTLGSNLVTSLGGSGASGLAGGAWCNDSPSSNGGNGNQGIINLYYSTNSGTTSPSANTTTLPIFSSTLSEESSPGPIAYWKFDEGVGSATYDSTSNQNNGTLGSGASAPSWIQNNQCVNNKCLGFNGTSSYVNMGSVSQISGLSQITVEAWINPNTINPPGGEARIFSKGTNDVLFQIITGGKLNVYLNNLGNFQSDASTIQANIWQHVAFTWETTTDTAKIYVNGRLVKTGTISTTTLLNTGNLYIGRYTNSAVGFFSGFIDDAKIYGYARSGNEILSDYNSAGGSKIGSKLGSDKSNSGALSNGLVGYWKMDEGVGTSAIDYSGNSYTATLGSGASAPTWAAGKFGTGLSFDGTGDYTTAGNPSNINTANNVTIGAWVNTSSSSVTYQNGQIAGNSNRFFLSIGDYVSSTPRVTGYVNNGGGTWGRIKGNTAINDGKWHYIAMTYDGANIYVYLDGNLDATPYPYNGTLATASDFYIGSYISGNYTNASIDEVRVYNRALTINEIKTIYSYASGPVAEWKFEDGDTTAPLDTSGKNNNLSINASAGSITTGKFGKGMKLTNAQSYLTTNTYTLPNYTVQWWIKPDSANDNQSLSDGSSINFWAMTHADKSITIYTHGGADAITSPINTVQLGVWQNFAFTFSNGTGKLYKNGILVASGTSLVNTGTFSSFAISMDDSTYIDGAVDEVTIFDYARTQKQIVETMNGDHPAGGSPIGSQALYWKFDENISNTAYDNIGVYNGTIYNTTPHSTDAKYGKSLSFDGTFSQVIANSSSGLRYQGDDLTISAWIKPDSSDDGGSIISKPWNGSGQYNYRLVSSGGNNPTLTLVLSGATSYSLGSGSSMTANNWHYVAATIEGSTNKVKIYIDGQLVNSGTNTITSWTPPSGDSNLNLVVGCIYPYGSAWCAGSTTHAYKGYIDEVKIYNSTLSESEILIDYNQGQSIVLGAISNNSSFQRNSSAQIYCIPGDTDPCTPPVGHWNFDEGTGSIVGDFTGTGGTGLWSGTLGSQWKIGKTGNAGSFNGTDNYVNIAHNSALAVTGDITIEAWLYPTSFSQTAIVVSKDVTNAPNPYIVYLESTTGRPTFLRGGGGVCTITASSGLSLNQWNHLIVTASGINISFYINGTIVGTPQTCAATGTDGGSSLRIGATSGPSNHFSGKIDDVKIFNYVRSAKQILWDYNKGLPIGWWKLDEGQGSTAFDSSGLGNNGLITVGAGGTQTILGTAVSAGTAWGNGATGKFNGSLSFDGTDDYISTPTQSIPSDITVSVWAYSSNFNQNGFLVGKNPVNAEWEIFFEGLLKWRGGDGTGPTCPLPTNNQWHHFVGTQTGTTAKLYIDGVQCNSGTAGAIGNGTGTIDIGRFSGGYYFSGKIDEVQIYSYVLSNTQIRNLYNQGASVRFGPSSGTP